VDAIIDALLDEMRKADTADLIRKGDGPRSSGRGRKARTA
jgi:hypothetical protein